MLLLSASDKIQAITGSAAAVKVFVHWTDFVSPSTYTPSKDNIPSIATATTTDILAGATSTARRVQWLSARNDHATTSTDVTIQLTDGTDVTPLWKGTLLAGESVNYSDGGNWQYLDANGAVKAATTKLNVNVRVTADVTNATTSFADITGLTAAIKAGKNYGFEAFLQYSTDASTTGAQFGVNGPTLTSLRAGAIETVTPSATAAAMSAGSVTAYDTAMVVQTTGPSTTVAPGLFAGTITCSADGTFAMRSKSEVAVAGGLVIKAGSWLSIWELDN